MCVECEQRKALKGEDLCAVCLLGYKFDYVRYEDDQESDKYPDHRERRSEE